MCALKIVACEKKNTHMIVMRICMMPSEDGDVRSYNVCLMYLNEFVDGEKYLPGRPADDEHPFYEIVLRVSNSHRDRSNFGLAYKRLDFGSVYTPAVANIHEFLYTQLKHNIRKSMNEYRAEKSKSKKMKITT